MLILLVVSFTGCSHKNDESKRIKIGFLMETYNLDRWQRDEKYFTEKANSLGAEVLRVVADGDQDRQNKQAETLITQGVDVLVVIPKNLNTASRIIKSAHEKNIPVMLDAAQAVNHLPVDVQKLDFTLQVMSWNDYEQSTVIY